MHDAWLARLFVRFRDRRDGRALAAVFDATARELIGVAAHLVPSLDQAEDAVQTTFQRAIEHADRFDESRSFKGWLYGILWREAARIARTERRTIDPGAFVPRSSLEPADELVAEELPAAVRAAVARLPAPYREVLEPVLCEERSTREVAERLGRSPGTVRVQLQRGLERLRRELPAARRAAASPPVRERFGSMLGLAALRERVLAHAGFPPSAVPAASAAFHAWQLLRVAITPGAIAIATVLAVTAGLGMLLHDPREGHGSGPGRAPALASARELVVEPIARPSEENAPTTAREPIVPANPPRSSGDAGAAETPAISRPEGTTLRGRITCAGEPVTGIRVSARTLAGDRASTAEGVDAGSGEYTITGLLPGRHELIVGGASVLRQYLEVELDPGENWFDVELPPGRIVVRVMGVDFLPDRPDDEAGFDRRHVLVFPRGWYQESGGRGLFLEPDASGRFEARGLPPDDYVVWVNHRARQRVWPVQVTVTAEEPLQEVELRPANELARIEGYVTNAPLAGPAGGLSVAVLRLDPRGPLRTGYAEVDSRGVFEEDVEPGDYGLLVSAFDVEAPFTWVPRFTVHAGARTAFELTLPPSRAISIRLDAGNAWTPRSVWRLRVPTGEWLSYILFIGSEAEGRRSHARPFRLPYGDYAVEADFGDPTPVVVDLTVVPGDGVQEIVVERP